MARVLITGSAGGLGWGAAQELLDQGHEVVLHARSAARADDIDEPRAAVVVGDLSSTDGTRAVAEQTGAIGGIDAVIHNAAVYGDPETLQVNVLAPYVLTAWIEADRLVYLSSDMHRSGDPSLAEDDWTARRWSGTQAYCDSKLVVTALAFAVARRRSKCQVDVVNPGWVPTRMGGPGATDDLELGHRTQAWLAVRELPEVTACGYWFHQEQRAPAPAALDEGFQEAVLEQLARLTDVPLG